MPRNPATRMIAIQARKVKVRPYEADEIRKLMDAALGEFGGVRWVIALALGLRQGELLALQWSDIDLQHGELTVGYSRPRPQYRHGCSPPCGQKYPGKGPDKVRINPERGETKSDASHRTIGMPDELTHLLTAHRDQQDRARNQAGDQSKDGDWVFTDRFGEPVNDIGDYRRWKALIKKSGVRDARLHDARHTAATTLLLLGVSERAVIDIMGWSTGKMTLVYQHITAGVRKDVAGRVGTYIWGGNEALADPTQGSEQTPPDNGEQPESNSAENDPRESN